MAAATARAQMQKAPVAPAAASIPSTAVLPSTAPPVISLRAAPSLGLVSGVFAPGRIRGGGEPIAPSVRTPIERSIGADLGQVRVHADAGTGRAVDALGARALTYGTRIFLGSRERSGDLPLIAHEAAHVVQQRGGVAAQAKSDAGSTDALEREADRTAAAVTRGEPAQVIERTSPRPLFIIGSIISAVGDAVGAALDFVRDRARAIPGYDLLGFVLGRDPITQQPVSRNAVNLIRALIGLWPAGNLVFEALERNGIIDRVGGWLQQQVDSLAGIVSGIRAALDRFLRTLGPTDILSLSSVWDRARRIFSEPVDHITSFVRGLVSTVIQFIKDAILMPLARLAQGTRGWDLLCAVLGRNPITGEPVPRNAETLIGGFMKLIGQEEVWGNIKRANAVGRAWAWFQGALAGVLSFVREVPTLFVQALRSLEIADIVVIPRAFMKVAGVFGNFTLRFISWAGEQVWTLLQIIFEVVAPQVMVYLRRAGAALRTIIRDPIRFIGNLVRAGIQGLRQFATNFLTHLRASLIGWLTGAMSGANIYIPQAFTLREILKFILSVLGLTWQNIRGKLVRAIGETAVAALETGFDIVATLVREGPAAAWQKILESLTNLRELVMEQIMTFVRDRVVQAAITRLVTSLNPAGAFIQAIIAIYNTVMFFVERMRQIAQVAAAFIDSIAAIASGVIGAAANRVEQTMAGLLTLVISFLARIAGLGRVSDAVTNIINRVRQPIDRALDRVVEWIRERTRGFLERLSGGSPQARLRQALDAARSAVSRFSGRRVGTALLRPFLQAIRLRFQMRSLEAVPRGNLWSVRGSVNPEDEVITDALVEGLPQAPLTVSTGPTMGISYYPQGDRARRAAGWLSLSPGNRSGSAQAVVSGPVNLAIRRLRDANVEINSTFDAGHLIADRYGGAGDQRNLVPMERTLNQNWFRVFEARVAARLRAGDSIYSDVQAVYVDSQPLRGLIDHAEAIPPPLVAVTLDAFRRVPLAVNFMVGRRRPDGTNEVLATETFDTRLRLPVTIGRAARTMVVGPIIQRAEDVYRVG